MLTVTAQVLKFGLQTGSIVILARLLTPADFGLIAMVAPITGFVSLFKDLGLSMATIQREQVTHTQISTLFWINIVLSVALATIIVGVAPLIGWFYDEPRVQWVMVALVGQLVLSGLAAQHQALLQRWMQFGRLAAVEVTAQVVGVVAAVYAALQGFGYWALVAMTLSSALVTTVLVWIFVPWRPGRARYSNEVATMLRFGGGLTGFNIVNYAARNADDVLIGRFLGAGALGLYSKAYQLLLLPVGMIRQPISRVVIPALSRLQNEPAKYRDYVTQALSATVFLSAPLIIFCLLEADLIIRLVLGEQWLPAADVFRILGFAALAQSFNVVTGWVYTSLGQSDRWFRWGLVFAAVITGSFIIGIRWGILGVSLAYTVATYLMLYPSMAFCFREAPVAISTVFTAVWRPFVAGASGAVVVLSLRFLYGSGSEEIVVLFIEGTVFLAAYLLGWLLVPGGKHYVLIMIKAGVRSIRRRRGRMASARTGSTLTC